ncbi:hypothetical protein, partial [Burkholderia sp. Se-20378]|uniref:hypothetical protein n=1 Tax=Burkholderia sp. Se-20378 TaxID=2703899 RepID=UPI00197DE81F
MKLHAPRKRAAAAIFTYLAAHISGFRAPLRFLSFRKPLSGSRVVECMKLVYRPAARAYGARPAAAGPNSGAA